MRTILILLIFISLCTNSFAVDLTLSDTIWQKNEENIRPTSVLAFLEFKITNDRLIALQNTNVFLVNTSTKQVYANTTNSDGQVIFLVPVGMTYEVNLLGSNAYRTIPLKNAENLTKRIGFTYVDKKVENHWDLTTLEDIGSFDTIIQNVKVTQKPTQTEALIHIALKSKDGSNQSGVNVTLMDRENKLIYLAHTQSNGIADFFIHNNKTYFVGVGINPQFSMLEVQDLPNLEGTKRFVYEPTFLTEIDKNDTITQTLRKNQNSTSDRVFVTAKVEDLDYKPLANEKFMMLSRKTMKTYFGLTDKSGKVNFLLPKGDTYYISFEYRNVKDSVEFKYDNAFADLSIEYRYIGSEAYRKRMIEKERLVRERDSLDKVRRFQDSLRIELLGTENFLEQMEWGKDKEKVKALIEKRALFEKEQLAKDPKFFVKAGREVQEVFRRMGKKWTNKVIVTDLTGSMYPYMDQILVWHAFNNMLDKGNNYIFFNDGDKKPYSEKLLGKTGGIYTSPTNSMDNVLQTMLTTMKGGNGAESPENDLEALLKSQNLAVGGKELILIADNYSDVRDISLLMYLKVPVRVVLCGVSNGINEDYLEIAYATNGSVHTIEEDIDNLKSKINGNQISIAGHTYKFNRGIFLKVD